MRKFNLVGCILAAGLGGCSLYPIPDDVSPYSTERIVRYARCEIKQAVLDHMVDRKLITSDNNEAEIGALFTAAKAKESRIKKALAEGKTPTEKLDKKETQLVRLAKVGVVYQFDFNITEHNRTG